MPQTPQRVVSWLLAGFVAVSTSPAAAIIIRHDREDHRYQELAKGHPQVVQMNTQKPGKPPDGVGTLVGRTWVATAAHVAVLIGPGHRVTVGERDYAVRASHLHPEWTDGPHDIALIRLSTEVTDVEPALLYAKRDEADQVVTVVGMGDTGTGLTGPAGNDARLRAATNRIDSATDLWLKFAFDRGESATELEGISGPGDSGGPAFLDTPDGRFLLGVGSGQSTRATGGREGLYGVVEYYTRVSTHIDWLRETMLRSDAGPATPDA